MFLSYKEGRSTIYYDSIVAGPNLCPATAANVMGINQRYAPFVTSNWSNLFGPRVTWKIEIAETGKIYKDLKFPTVQDYVDWKNDKLGYVIVGSDKFFTETPILKPYDEVEESVPVISKIYGINRLYSALKGGRHYKSSVPHCGHFKNWEYGCTIMRAMWEYHMPWVVGFVTDDDFNPSMNGHGHKAIWCPRAHQRMYGMPMMNTTIQIPHANAGRYTGCNNWENFNLMWAPKDFQLQNPTALVYFGEENINGVYEIYSIQGKTNRRKLTEYLTQDLSSTGIIFYKAEEINIDVDKDYAVYIKPLGIDIVYINWFDTERYELEAIYFNKNIQKCHFKVIDSNLLRRQFKDRDVIALTKSVWTLNNTMATAFPAAGGWNRVFNVFFRLREKISGRVGALSNARITAFYNHTNAPYKLMVM